MTKPVPDIKVFSCGFGWGYCGDRVRIAAEIPNLVTVSCCGSIEAEQMLAPFREGCDGVLILACPRGECHFQDGDWQCLKRMELLKRLLEAHGIAPERLGIRFGNDPEGETLPAMVKEFSEELKRL